MIIYGSSFSPFVRKLLAYCEERGIGFELKSVGIGDPDPGYAAASPLKKMPAIDDDGFMLADSSAIIHYLEAKHGAALIPQEARARGRTIWFEEFADTVMGACIGAMFFNRVVAPKFLGRAGDMAAADAAEADLWPKICDYLQGELADGREFLVGDALTLADLAVGSSLHNIDHAGAKWCDGHDAVKAYFERIKARPSFAKWTAKEYATLAG